MFVARDRLDPPEVSVIIPLHQDSEPFRKCLDLCMAMQVDTAYEVVVISDQPVHGLPDPVVKATTGSQAPTSPAIKRDIGETVARGGTLAFLDDDAYPSTDWLDAAMQALQSPSVHGVGGPGLTPPFSSWRERLSGALYESRLGSGPLRFRFLPVGEPRNCEDLPAYNLLLRRDALKAVGGWGSNYYGGEDTELCLKLVTAGFTIRYDPNVVVYHHRRPTLCAHLRQVQNVGRHRGFFARNSAMTSRRAIYRLPMFGTLAVGPVVYLMARSFLAFPLVSTCIGVAGWLAVSATVLRKLGLAAAVFPFGLCAHHIAYGLGFLRGRFSSELDDFGDRAFCVES